MGHGRIKKVWSFPLALWIMGMMGKEAYSTSRSLSEKRKYPRVPISIRVTNISSGSFSHYHAANISTGGMFLKSLEPPPKGTMLSLKFKVNPDGDEIIADAEVVWSRGYRPGEETPSGMGVRFIGLSDTVRRQIEAFVENAP